MSKEQSAYENLTDRERRLVDVYLRNGMVKCRAYFDTMYGGKEEDPGADSVRQIAYRKFTEDHIKAAISERLREAAMSTDEALFLLKQQAQASHRPFIRIGDDGNIYYDFSHPRAQENLHLIRKIKQKRKRSLDEAGEAEWETEWVEVDLHDPQRALDMILKAHGAYGAKGTEEDPIHVTGFNFDLGGE